MPDPASIAAALNAVKSATDIARLLKDSTTTLEKAEMKLKLAELVSALADAKIEVAQIQDILMVKDRQIRDLEEAQALQVTMAWKSGVYWKEGSTPKEGPFCPQCYDSARKAIRLQTLDAEHWRCLTCEKDFYGQSYRPQSFDIDSI